MDNDYKVFWDEATRQLLKENKINQQEYEMWFLKMLYTGQEGHSLIFSVPSKFYRDQVISRYLVLVEDRLSELSGSNLSLKFEIRNSKNDSSDGDTAENRVIKTSSARDSTADTDQERKPHSQLRGDYTFDQYVIGNNNSFAVSAAQAISTAPGKKYNPFLIYGGVGLGKTHLMQAIGSHIHYSMIKKKVVYITAETFINEFIQSIQTNTQRIFKNKYRKVDVLLIDDIHDLHGKKETQEELFHTFNALYDARKQLVFTCDRPPSELKNFASRLQSRFDLGLNVDLQPPNFETRYAILNKKLESIQVDIPEKVIDLIARNVTSNVRDLEASLTKMAAYSDLVGKKITLEIAKHQLKGVFSGILSPKITIDRVQRAVSEYFNITPADLKSKKRTKQVTFPRQISMYIIREITDFSTTEIGLEFGGRDHTTVMHSCQRIENRMKIDPTIEPSIANLIRTIKESG